MLEKAFVEVFDIFGNICRDWVLRVECSLIRAYFRKQNYILRWLQDRRSEWCMAKSVCKEVLANRRVSYGLNPPPFKNIKHTGDYSSRFILVHVLPSDYGLSVPLLGDFFLISFWRLTDQHLRFRWEITSFRRSREVCLNTEEIIVLNDTLIVLKCIHTIHEFTFRVFWTTFIFDASQYDKQC